MPCGGNEASFTSMIKYTAILLFLFFTLCAGAKESIDPVITPGFYSHDTQITITYDVTGTRLAELSDAFAWVWIPGKNADSKYNVNPASTDQAKTNNVKFIKSVVSGKTLFIITFITSSLFDSDISAEAQFGILLKGNDWNDGQTTDYVAKFWDGAFRLVLKSPTQRPFFGNDGDNVPIIAETPSAADYSLYIDDNLIDTQNDVTQYMYTHTLSQPSDYGTLKLVASEGGSNDEVVFQILSSASSPEVVRPESVKAGINYDPNDAAKVTLCLWAPQKTSVYATGDFSDWKILPEYLMKRDGEHFWIEVTDVTAGQEYAFQYLVDQSVYVADPYADKILDPDDRNIPVETYSGLIPYPAEALRDQWYLNRLAIFQTAQTPYNWKVTDFVKPKKEELVIYELLVRDFFSTEERNYQNLIDTLSYFKKLGINAIELMPVTEFNGNESWGYNPTFMFAPDKYYGTKNKMKEFIDKCHEQGIAVILDVVMNQQDLPNPYVLMYYDFASGKPTANSPWFNQKATHPYNVFFDLNHESTYTQEYLDTVNYYWIKEYKFDGYRFDLSKGFTQKNANGNVNTWGQYDASRIAILKRMADKIWGHSPDAYVILEHFADNDEEKELAEYKANEGKGMLLWGNYNNAYSQNALSSSGSDFSSIYHANRTWTVPHLIGYMESHDEERLMYRNLQTGKSSGTYNIKTLNTALDRLKAASLMFYTIPGPKMLWQFGELGYDQSINRCPDGSISDGCRVSPKPVHWNYRDDPQRYALYTHIAELLELRRTHDVFREGTATIQTGPSLVKQIGLKNLPYTPSPADASEMNVQLIANFDVVPKDGTIAFPHSGVWYEYYSNQSVQVSSSPHTVSLGPGEYRLYTDYPLKAEPVDPVTSVGGKEISPSLGLYPNPVEQILFVDEDGILSLSVYTVTGRNVEAPRLSDNSWSLAGVPKGLYIVEIKSAKGVKQGKIVKK